MLLGPIVNSLLIIIGTLLGLLLKKNIPEKLQSSIVNALALVVIAMAISSLYGEVSSLNVLLSMVVGTFIGEVIDLDDKLQKLGDKLQASIKSQSDISKGFVEASLLFCVGSMAILGSLQSGLLNQHETLITKGIIDGITAIFYTAKHGIGVIFSAVLLFIYQGGLTILSSFLAPLINDACLAQISYVGGIILLTVGLNMLNIGHFKSMNMVPAIIVTVILTYLGI